MERSAPVNRLNLVIWAYAHISGFILESGGPWSRHLVGRAVPVPLSLFRHLGDDARFRYRTFHRNAPGSFDEAFIPHPGKRRICGGHELRFRLSGQCQANLQASGTAADHPGGRRAAGRFYDNIRSDLPHRSCICRILS
ncbi:hypothetical protein D3C72_848030 [compost metagenome]